MPQAPGRQFGKYTFIEPLAKGGMAETYRARFTGAAGVTKDVVIKKILPHFADDKSFVQMFVNEAKIAATFSHGNIAQVFDFGEIDGEYFLAMELVDGQSLQQVLKRAKQLEVLEVPQPLAILVTMRICEGLHYAHTRMGEDGRPLRIVHRDVTPENVIISYEGQVKLVDFGIAKARTAGRSETEPGMVKGKYLYFSPEQASGQEVDHRTDVYSAGLVLYSMLCGKLPFEGQAVQVMHQIVSVPVPLPRTLNKNMSSALERILLRSLAKDRNERYQTAQAFGEALSSYLYSEEPSFTPTRLASFMTYLFKPTLEAEGRKVDVPDDFLKQLTAWQEKSAQAPAVRASRGSGARARAEQEAQMLRESSTLQSNEDSTPGPEDEELTQRNPYSTPTGSSPGPLAEVTVSTDGSTGGANEPTVEAIRYETQSISAANRDSALSGKARWAWLLAGLFVLAVLVPLGLLRFYKERGAGGVVEVVVTSEPSKAWVVLDGRRVPGQTPLTIPNVAVGEKHRVTVLLEGAWKPFEVEFTPRPPGPEALFATLESAAANPLPLGPPAEAPSSGVARSESSNEARFPVPSFTVVARQHRFSVNDSLARYQELDPNERYHLWTEGALTLNRELGQSTRVVLYVAKGAAGSPDVVGLAGPRPVVLEHAQALYALVVDPDFKNNQGMVTLNLEGMRGAQRLKLAVDARKNAVELPAGHKFTLSGLNPGQSYRLVTRPAAETDAGPTQGGKVACVSMLNQQEPDGVTGGQLLLDAGQSYELTGAESLECAYLDVGGDPGGRAMDIDLRAGPRPFYPPL